MQLGLCMIVKNEEQTLPQCLSSVRGVVDEMVVLDTGSSDRTPDVAKKFGAKVYTFEWCNDFAQARNEALKYVHSNWVLVLDADEMLVPDIVPSLKQAIQHGRFLLVNLLRQEVGAAQSPYSQVSRLFRRHPNLCFSRPYHALVDDSVARIMSKEPQWQVGYLPNVAIVHEGYQRSAIAQKDKFAQAQTAMEGFYTSHPNDPYVCSKLGALYVETGSWQRGIELLEQGLKRSGLNAQILYELHYHLGIAYSRLQQLPKAIAHYRTAIGLSIYPLLKLGAYNNLGNLRQAAGDLNGAKMAYEIALQIDPKFAAGYYNLGMTLKAMGFLNEAIATYHKAIALNPKYAEAYQNLGVVLLKSGKLNDSLAAFKQAIALHETQSSPEAERLRQGLEEMGFLV